MDDFGAESLDKIKSDLSYEKESGIEVEDNSLIETSKKEYDHHTNIRSKGDVIII